MLYTGQTVCGSKVYTLPQSDQGEKTLIDIDTGLVQPHGMDLLEVMSLGLREVRSGSISSPLTPERDWEIARLVKVLAMLA